jgi:surface polysaccharide O-acyltransferase-like enzyme
LSRWLTHPANELTTPQNPQNNNLEMLYFLIIWLVANGLMPVLDYFWGLQTKIELRYFSGFIGYFVLGFYLGSIKFNNKNWVWLLVFLSAWLIACYTVYQLSWFQKKFDNRLSDYLSISVMAMSASIFLIFKNWLNLEFWPKIMAQLDACSYGVYLVHYLILKVLSRQLHLNYTFLNPFVGIVLQFLACGILSFSLVYLIRRVPKGNWLVG